MARNGAIFFFEVFLFLSVFLSFFRFFFFLIYLKRHGVQRQRRQQRRLSVVGGRALHLGPRRSVLRPGIWNEKKTTFPISAR